MPTVSNSTDAGAELRRDLDSPIRAVRLFAYDEILRTRSAMRLRDALKQRETLEDDEECQILLRHALAMASASEKSDTSSAETVPAEKSGVLLSAIGSRTPEEWQKMAQEFPASLAGESDPLILAELIRRIGRYLDPAQRRALEPYLVHPLSLVRSAALAVLIDRFPEELAPRLPQALRSRDPRLRALAVRGLARIDPEEAIRHLEIMLLGSDPGLRRFGLQIVSLLPFPLVRDLMVRFALVAEEPVLVRAASALFRSNPDPDVGFRLLEAEQQASEKQKPVLRLMFQQAELALESSGILGAEAARHRQQIQQWERKLVLRASVRDLLAQIPEDAPDPQHRLIDLLGVRLQEPLVRQALEESLTWSLPPHLEGAVKGVLHPPSAQAPVVAPPPSAMAAAVPAPDLERRLAKLGISEKSEPGLDLVTQALTDARQTVEVQALALRAAAVWAVKGFEEQAARWLVHADHRLVAGALEYLTVTDPERVYPQLGRFLASPQPLVKLRAILLLKRYDLPQAISALLALIRLPDSRTHRLLATSLVQFEFSLLRGPLTDFLCQTGGGTFLRESLCLFQANPARENLFCLYRIEQAVAKTHRFAVQKTRESCENLLIELGLLSRDEIVSVQAQWELELQRKQARAHNPPSYAIEQVFSDLSGISVRFSAVRRAFAEIDEATVKKTIFMVFVFAPLVYAWWTYFLQPTTPFSLAPGANTALQRLARTPTVGKTAAPVATRPPAPPPSTLEDFSRALEREIDRELSAPLPGGMSQDAAWMFQASEHPAIGRILEKIELGRGDEAIEDLERLLVQAPDNPYLQMRVLSILCRLYQSKGDAASLRKAQERFATALDRLPGFFPVSFREFLRAQEQMLKALKQPNWQAAASQTEPVDRSQILAGISQLEAGFPGVTQVNKKDAEE
ncbi:MAG TPA: hypothetical protein PKO06_08265 [Candidatus Ozemobacteraceae bacterium]|nr:hypothetical protein [Candidatus Ozemobacteraceae bacterium]